MCCSSLNNCLPFVAARKGATGTTGATGATGSNTPIIDKQLTEQVLAATGAYTDLITFTLNPTSYRLSADGDTYEIEAEYRNTGTSPFSVGKVVLNATDVGSANFNTFLIPGASEVKVRIKLTRLSATSIYASVEAVGYNHNSGSYGGFGGGAITVLTLASNTFTLKLQGFKVVGGNLSIVNAYVKYFKTV